MPLPPSSSDVVPNCKVLCSDYRELLLSIESGTVHLILTDPPYAISRTTGFANGNVKVARFAVSMDFGAWDHVGIDLEGFATSAYSALCNGGTVILWYDLWKITHVRDALLKAGFRMLRTIIWQKTNPVPLNSKRMYLSNSREIAVVGVKGSNPTFNSEYDKGIYTSTMSDIVYEHPIPRHSGNRIHPTQKPLELFTDIVHKHSNQRDLICDPFLGSGTTALASLRGNRRFIGCDIQQNYINLAKNRILDEYSATSSASV